MTIINQSLLLNIEQDVVQDIIKKFDPDKILLFGSYAYGNANEDSDIDFLVVMSQPPKLQNAYLKIAEISQRLLIPIQILFIDKERFEETKDVVGGVAYPAYHQGKVLYERT